MSTIPPVTPTGTDPVAPSKLDSVLKWLDFGLKAASSLTGGPIGTGLSLADLALAAAIHAKQVYELETGQPIDLNKIPPEEPV